MTFEWEQGRTKEIEGFSRDWLRLELIVACHGVGDSRPVTHLATIRKPPGETLEVMCQTEDPSNRSPRLHVSAAPLRLTPLCSETIVLGRGGNAQ